VIPQEEERIASRLPQWPGTPGPVVPPNAGLKLFGGAAFERCLHEFQEAAHALQFPASKWDDYEVVQALQFTASK
jgi:hypothetical protein